MLIRCAVHRDSLSVHRKFPLSVSVKPDLRFGSVRRNPTSCLKHAGIWRSVRGVILIATRTPGLVGQTKAPRWTRGSHAGNDGLRAEGSIVGLDSCQPTQPRPSGRRPRLLGCGFAQSNTLHLPAIDRPQQLSCKQPVISWLLCSMGPCSRNHTRSLFRNSKSTTSSNSFACPILVPQRSRIQAGMPHSVSQENG